MKTFFTSILAIGCAMVLLLGNIHWNKKIEVHGASQMDVTNQTDEITSTKEDNSNKENSEKIQLENLLKLTANWPEKSKVGLKKALLDERTYHILFVGSTAQGSGSNSYPELVKKEMINRYSEDIVSVSAHTFDMTSRDFVNEKKYEELLNAKPDMVILEPFTLKDNGIVSIENSIENIQIVLDSIKADLPNTTVILQPPHPLFNAKFYPIQVSELKAFAETNNIPYLDHWTAWPDQTNVEMKEFLVEDQSQPSEKGHRVWASFILDYLISVE